MSQEFSFDDLLKAPHQRVMKAEIDGLGVVTLTELTDAELDDLKREGEAVGALGEQLSECREKFRLVCDASTVSESAPEGNPEAEKLKEKIAEEDMAMVARWAARLLAGRSCSDEEVEKIRANLSPAVRQDVYLRGLRFNVKDDSYREHIEKNS